MIDVPVEVKDALREGTYKKNYRFVIPAEDIPEGYYEIARLAENQKIQLPHAGTYKFFGTGESSWTGVTTWENWEPGSELEWLPASITSPNTELTSYMNADIISVSGFNGIDFVSLMEWREASHEDSIVIDNNNLVSESVSIDERMCSGDTLKFGLCEGSSLEFQYFNKPNITGKRVQVFIDVDYGANEPHTIPMGFFDVKKCSRQASTGIIKATCYNKLQSEYLDAKANEKVLKQFDDENSSVLVYDLKRLLLEDYEIEQAEIVDITESYRGYAIDLDDATTTKYDSSWLGGDRGPLGPANPVPTYPPTAVGTAVKFYFATNEFVWDMDPTKYYRIDSAYDLDTFERSFYNYVERMITWVYFPAATEAQYMSNLVQSSWGTIPSTTVRTWKNIFAIILVKNDNTEEWYSTIGKQYGMNVAGTMSDLAKKTFTGYKQMSLWMPECVGDYYYSGSTGSFHKLCNFYGSDFEYHYWEETGVELGTNTWKSFRFPDDSIIPESLRPTQFMNVLNVESLSDAEKVEVQINTLPDYTLRDLTTASYETTCTFGQLSRTTDLFSGVELNHSRLYPADSLYPATDLYPSGAALSGFKSMYSKLWADEGNIHKWRYLIITYKGLNADQQEEDFTLQRTVNADGTDDYNMSDNWLFRNLVWTYEQVEAYALAMVAKMQDVTWFPFEMWCAGLPYLETGDEIEIPLNGESYTSYVLQRQLKGIQNLQDTYINGTLDIF